MSCGCNENRDATAETDRSGEPAQTPENTILVEFLYLDTETCQPCGGTGQALDQARAAVEPALAALGLGLEVRQLHMKDRDTAIRHRLVASPTIRVQGRDIDPSVTEDDCPSCGSLVGGGPVDCRTWHWRGKVWQSAPPGRIAETVLRAALDSGGDCCGPACCDGTDDRAPEEDYVLPANLAAFFEARAAGSPRCC